MGVVAAEGKDGMARALSSVAEPIHGLTYYSPEALGLSDEGYKGWWHTYFAYRPAPMGEVGATTVTAVFYNFAPRMVARAVPGVWQIHQPAEITALRLDRVSQALTRVFGDGADPSIREGAQLIRTVADCSLAGRPLFAAYCGLDWPENDLLAIWHGCTLLREHRGDSHNAALAAAQVDGVESHVLMVGRGHGNRATISAIRGWNDEEWAAAEARLIERGWLEVDGSLTTDGREARSAIERHTDRLAGEPLERLGVEGSERLIDILRPLADHLATTGEVSTRWPPQHLMKPSGQ